MTDLTAENILYTLLIAAVFLVPLLQHRHRLIQFMHWPRRFVDMFVKWLHVSPDVPADMRRTGFDSAGAGAITDEVAQALKKWEFWRVPVLWLGRMVYAAPLILLCAVPLISNAVPIGRALEFIVLYGSVGVIFCAVAQRKFSNAVENDVVKAMSARFGLGFHGGNASPLLLGMSEQLKLIPSYNIDKTQFTIEGIINGYKITAQNARLEKRSGGQKNNSRTTVFNGCVIRIKLHTPVSPFIYFCPDSRLDRNSLGFALPNGVTRCRLEDTVFEKHFEVFTNDQIGARTILTPLYLEKFKYLKQVWPYGVIHGAIMDQMLLLTVKDGFTFPKVGLNVPIQDPKRFDVYWHGFQAIIDLVEAVTPYDRNHRTQQISSGGVQSPYEDNTGERWAS